MHADWIGGKGKCENVISLTCAHAAQHGPVADARRVGVAAGGVVGSQAGQKQAPGGTTGDTFRRAARGETTAGETGTQTSTPKM